MNVLFLTMNSFSDIHMHNIYSDLMLEYIRHGHRPYIVAPREKRKEEESKLTEYDDYSILTVKVGNMSNVSFIEKGISTITLNYHFFKAISKFLGHIDFDLIIYSTPPISLVGTIKKLKNKYRCPTYLMLKDIFPQNAVDLQLFSRNSPVYFYFRGKEIALYRISDYIGCMSQGNVDYILKHNSFISERKIEVCPNGIIPLPVQDRIMKKNAVRKRYGVKDNQIIYLYGGNLGAPQGIPHLINCLKDNAGKEDRYFIICGSGNEQRKIQNYIEKEKPNNVMLIDFLQKSEYDELVAGCDVGLVFLDSRFSIPNYPSRILSYMENSIPVVVCADSSTDVGSDAEKNGYGLYCESDDPKKFTSCIDKMDPDGIETMGKKARKYLEKHFTAENCYRIISNHWGIKDELPRNDPA